MSSSSSSASSTSSSSPPVVETLPSGDPKFCAYVFPSLNRTCKMNPKKGLKYCSEHLWLIKVEKEAQLPSANTDTADSSSSSSSASSSVAAVVVERVPCPFDSSQ